MKKRKKEPIKRCAIGGQAVLEGVMMKSPTAVAMAVRRADGEIETSYTPYQSKAKKGTVLGWPIIRGVVIFIESLVNGMENITKSAELYGEEAFQEEPSKFEKWLAEKTGKSVEKVVIGFAVVLAIALAVLLFFMLPTFIGGLVFGKAQIAPIWKSLFEGIVRMLIFLAYVGGIAFMKDIKRLYMYHGAEHKTLACYEYDAELTVENAKKFSRFHPRCGTNYMFLIMAISILLFAVVGWSENILIRLLTRIVMIPVVAGIAYEILKWGGNSENWLAKIVRAPGLLLQRMTVHEPDDQMLEIAITAFNMALDYDAWKESQKSKESEQENISATQQT